MGDERTMDWAEFEHRRVSGFPKVRRGGYDHGEVDRFLASVSDWLKTGAAEELGDEVVRHKLEQVGQTTARMLLIAEQDNEELRRRAEEECADLRAKAQAAANESAARILETAQQRAEQLRRTTEGECADLRREADAVANETCGRAEKYATTVRAQADEDAQRMIDDAAVQARTALREETERLQAELDAVVAEMDRRRNVAVDEVERLRADLLTAISPHAEHTAPAERDGRTAGRRQAPAYGSSRHADAEMLDA
jgi:DivIVA domain-containing protein